MEEKEKTASAGFDLSELTDFQFGPAWARKDAAPAAVSHGSREGRAPRKFSRNGENGRQGEERRRPRDNRESDRRQGPRGERRDFRDAKRPTRPVRERVAPVEGFRVELRPANSILEIFCSEIQKQKRSLPLLDLARIVMAAKDRYDLVFMKLENGPMLIHSRKGDGACWLTEEEALHYLWQAPWFAELYSSEEIETEAPSGQFNGVAVCSLGKEVIGPVNWHGYQSAMMNLYREKYGNMALDAFKNSISLDKSEESVAKWLEKIRHKTVWKATREGSDTVLEDPKAVEADFKAHHYDAVYETVDKVFINGATPRQVISPGLEAHLYTQSERTRRFPQMLIPNLCHGLARHHMPIYKWQGNHFTGPSRVKSIPADMVLADRMAAIVEWSKAHSGEKLDSMFAELSGVPAGTDDAGKQAATEAYAPYAADLIWLLEQGFIVVTSDNAIWFPKGEAAPTPTKTERPKRHNKQRKAKPASEDSPKAE